MEPLKTFILASKNKKEQAILNLRTNNESDIKFFNFNYINKNFALGVKQGDSIKKIPLVINNNFCKFKLPSDLNLQKEVLCAVVDVSNAFCPQIVLSGSNNSQTENITIEENFVTKKPKDASVLYKQDSMEDIDFLVQKNLEEDQNSTYFDACAKCKYREAFYGSENCCNTLVSAESDKNLVEKETNQNKKDEALLKNEETIKKEEKLDGVDNFYNQIKEQIDLMFKKYKQYEPLTKVVANSNWIKIDYDSGEGFYVLGLIYDDDKNVSFISYGVPSTNQTNPPEDIKDFAQWLPMQTQEEGFLGFWLVYQNAVNGETVKVEYK